MSVLAWWFTEMGRDYYDTKKEKELLPFTASEKLMDAMLYGRGPLLYRVELSGKTEHETNKWTPKINEAVTFSEQAKVLWSMDCYDLLQEFSCRCSMTAIAMFKNFSSEVTAAVKAKRDWLAGKIDDAELTAICEQARQRAIVLCRVAKLGDLLIYVNAFLCGKENCRNYALDNAREAVKLAAYSALHAGTLCPKGRPEYWWLAQEPIKLAAKSIALASGWGVHKEDILEKFDRNLTDIILSEHQKLGVKTA